MNRKLKIVVICGGFSSEREISIKTGKAVYENLKKWEDFDVSFLEIKKDDYIKKIFLLKKQKIDIVFIALHGKFGEDGVLQSILDALEIKYTGSGVNASVICMNKHYAKNIFVANKIPTPQWQLIKHTDEDLKIPFPVIIKPVDEGSTIGVSLANNYKEYIAGLNKAFRYSNSVIVEKFIEGKELTVPILGDKILPIVEIIPNLNKFYDFNSKYKKGGSKHIIPANVEKKIYEKIKTIAKKAAEAIGCEVMCRVDIILEKKTNKIYVLEINSIPGMTETSLFPESARFFGISFPQLVREIVLLSLKKYS
ncbi:MAG: D-alanine--D-alanine ligase [Elusimicrobiota bacterium]|nr:D-alanine--D-alanine ligase [Endomicrobiia bacterium]MCX7910492.1 D-alanine--D-alanine ligase [Endomicrobiia bacterium]MDW8166008.1 D-alanine--D-alanine ligase [Elusimicrobiota bacterium]